MAGALRKTMVYLGLAEDDGTFETESRAVDPVPERERLARERERPYERAAAPAPPETQEREARVTPIKRNSGALAPVAAPEADPGIHRITTIHPRSYNDAKAIGESFRHGIPVIMNLSDMDDADAKRMVDFSAGLVFGLRGAIERVTSKVFLLSPEHLEVAGDDAGDGSEGGFYNQS